jgi:hypothetical protein
MLWPIVASANPYHSGSGSGPQRVYVRLCAVRTSAELTSGLP